ncbi:unnamed protein product [Aphanomyces euteiches]
MDVHFVSSEMERKGDTKCRYAYKNCPNTRTTKENGQLHSLCAFHRAKANVVQKIYARKRRLMKRQAREKLEAQRKAQAAAATATTTASSPTTTAKETDELNPPIDPIPYSTHPSDSPPKSALTQDDVATLQDLFEKL